MDVVVKQFEVWLVNQDPTQGSEIQKTRPCVIASSDELNRHLACVLAAPMTTSIRRYPFRIDLEFKRKKGQIALDQLRAIDKSRLVKKMGKLSTDEAKAMCLLLVEMFSYE